MHPLGRVPNEGGQGDPHVASMVVAPTSSLSHLEQQKGCSNLTHCCSDLGDFKTFFFYPRPPVGR